MSLRVPVPPEFFRWACERSQRDRGYLEQRFTKLSDWESGGAEPTWKQLESFAKATYTPFGYFFLSKPPTEKIPIPDLRTLDNKEVAHPSPNLLDTIYICQQRQEWYKDFARMSGYDSLDIVASAAMEDPIEDIAQQMRKTLGFGVEDRKQCKTWEDALRQFIQKSDKAGIMVMTSGVVGNNNYRKLEVNEFRGFALSDDLAPIVFINRNDSKAAQIFTLAHELAHIWLGESALTDVNPASQPSPKIEKWCNKVAAELLVPLAVIKKDAKEKTSLSRAMSDMAREYKVSTLVVLRRLLDAGFLDREAFNKAYLAEEKRLLREINKSSGGGNFYRTAGTRINKRFAHDLIISTFEGQTSFTEALHLLEIKKVTTLRELGKRMGIKV